MRTQEAESTQKESAASLLVGYDTQWIQIYAQWDTKFLSLHGKTSGCGPNFLWALSRAPHKFAISLLSLIRLIMDCGAHSQLTTTTPWAWLPRSPQWVGALCFLLRYYKSFKGSRFWYKEARRGCSPARPGLSTRPSGRPSRPAAFNPLYPILL